LQSDLAINPPIHMLVVDDDLVARRTLVGALQTAFAKPESAENGETALALTLGKPFDVIFLDVVMPDMNGFELCKKIRAAVPNRFTPVVFVTGQSDFDARAQMSRNGGDDLMGKPFLTSELTVKALTFALRGRLRQSKTWLKTQPGP
jgi:DNA-binding response OmpR family regulator